MWLEEKLLLSLSSNVEGNNRDKNDGLNLENALATLCEVFPGFIDLIKEKAILDFGCGAGYQSLAFAKNNAKLVLGLDVNQENVKKAKELALKFCLDERVKFVQSLPEDYKEKFDVVISQNSMEHFNDPTAALDQMKLALKQNGTILITFGPPWFAPYGSHTQFFTKLPYVNLFFNERTVMEVRSRFRNDGATMYTQVEGGLNKMSVLRFERLISNCGLRIKFKKYDCVKKINYLNKLPLARELFINRVSCILEKASL